MIKYEIKEGSTTTQFDTLELAKVYNSNVEIFEIEVDEPVTALTTEEKLLQDIIFGKNLIKEFLKENRDTPVSFKTEDNLNLLNKFATIEALCRFGSIKSVFTLIQSIEVDYIFTQERKNTFIEKIKHYLEL